MLLSVCKHFLRRGGGEEMGEREGTPDVYGIGLAPIPGSMLRN